MINRRLKNNEPIFIAEIGLNHNGSLKEADEMITAAARAGADAVKFQTFNPRLMNSPYTKDLLQSGTDKKKDFETIEFLSRFVLTGNDYELLKEKANREGVLFFSSPFDAESVDLLERLDVPMYKVASSEVTNTLLLRKIAETGKPVIMSTGMSGEDDLDNAVAILKGGAGELALLHCVSLYPLEGSEANLRRIVSLKNRYGLPTGISDHSRDFKTSVYGAVLGARIFERHFKLSSDHDCPDKDVSLTPEQFGMMKEEITSALNSLGSGRISFEGREADTARAAKRSLFAAEDIARGEVISDKNIVCLRPGTGIPANMIDEITGSEAVRNIKKDSLIKYEDLNRGDQK